MPEALHYSAAAKKKGSYALPAEFDAPVNQAVLYHAVRAYRNNQRHGTHDTKTRGEVSGGNQKPWRQKGTGRARQGSTRSPLWPGGGTAFGPTPHRYRTELPRKVRRLARQSAFNARAREGKIYVIESLDFEEPKTSRMAELLEQLELDGNKTLILTQEHKPNVFLSGRNIPGVRVSRFADASAFDLVWADAVVVEEGAIGGHAVAGSSRATARERRVKKAAAPRKAAAKAPAKKPAKKKPAATKAARPRKKSSDG
jgi:large subunit ribosomal protein L4